MPSLLLCLAASPLAAQEADPATPYPQPSQAVSQPPQPTTPPPPGPRDVFAEEEERRAPNTVFVEGLGAGLLYSFNYERLVLEDLGVRVGLGVYTVTGQEDGIAVRGALIMVPVTLSYLGIGSARHIFEIGGGPL